MIDPLLTKPKDTHEARIATRIPCSSIQTQLRIRVTRAGDEQVW